MNYKSITATYANLDDAIAAAKANGNDIYEGYENCIASEKRVNQRLNVTEYYLTDDNEILFVAHFDGERVLNRVSVHSTISAGNLTVGTLDETILMFRTDGVVNKSDRKSRRKICSENPALILIDESLAHKLAA
jgi:hypothetical protein